MNGSVAECESPTLQWKREHTARCRRYLLVSRLPGFGYAALLAFAAGSFFSDLTHGGADCDSDPQCSKRSLQRRAVVKGRLK